MAIKKATLGSHWVDAMSILAKVEQARSNRRQQSELLASLEEAQQRHDDAAPSLSNLSTRERHQVASNAADFRGQQRRTSADARLKHVREAARLRDEVQGARVHYASPVQMLMRQGLGSEKRSHMLHQIEHSGPTELTLLAEYAAATGDRELGAALCSRASRHPSSDRPFQATDLAEALVGQEHRRVTQALDEIDRLAADAVHADSAFERGGNSVERSIRIARSLEHG